MSIPGFLLIIPIAKLFYLVTGNQGFYLGGMVSNEAIGQLLSLNSKEELGELLNLWYRITVTGSWCNETVTPEQREQITQLYVYLIPLFDCN